MEYLIIVIFLFLTMYIYNIANHWLKIGRAKRLLSILISYIEICPTPTEPLTPYEKQNIDYDQSVKDAYHKVVSAKPKICEHLVNDIDLNYSKSYEDVYFSSGELYNRLLSKLDFYFHALHKSFNPFNSVAPFLRLPSKLLGFFGIATKENASRIINLLWWALSFLGGLFSNEIKEFIMRLIEKM